MKLVYFAWVRERIGLAEEDIDLPDSVDTVSALIGWLAARDEAYAHAFERPEVIRAALDKRHAPHDASLAGVTEVALFPPMTGG